MSKGNLGMGELPDSSNEEGIVNDLPHYSPWPNPGFIDPLNLNIEQAYALADKSSLSLLAPEQHMVFDTTAQNPLSYGASQSMLPACNNASAVGSNTPYGLCSNLMASEPFYFNAMVPNRMTYSLPTPRTISFGPTTANGMNLNPWDLNGSIFGANPFGGAISAAASSHGMGMTPLDGTVTTKQDDDGVSLFNCPIRKDGRLAPGHYLLTKGRYSNAMPRGTHLLWARGIFGEHDRVWDRATLAHALGVDPSTISKAENKALDEFIGVEERQNLRNEQRARSLTDTTALLPLPPGFEVPRHDFNSEGRIHAPTEDIEKHRLKNKSKSKNKSKGLDSEEDDIDESGPCKRRRRNLSAPCAWLRMTPGQDYRALEREHGYGSE